MKKYPILATLSGLAIFLILVGFVGSVPSVEKNDQADAVTMVFTPAGNVTKIFQASQELADLLEAETGLNVYAYVTDCFGSAVEAMAAQEADVGWLGPIPYVLGSDLYGIKAILTSVRLDQSYYRGQFLVRSDSGIHDISDLAGMNFAYTDSLSPSGYLYPAMQISQTQGISENDFFGETFFVGGHSGVVRAVYDGEYEGTAIHGGVCLEGARRIVESNVPDIYTKTMVISYTEKIPNDNVSVRVGLDQELVQQVTNGLMNLAVTKEGQDVLSELYGIQGFELANDSDYDIVRDYVAFYGINFGSCSESVKIDEETGGSLTYTNDQGRDSIIQLPSGMVDQPTRVSVSQILLPPNLPSDFNFTGDAFEINTIVRGTTDDGANLREVDTPTYYTITVNYDDSGLNNSQESNLRLYYWHDGTWVKDMSSRVKIKDNIITAMPDHFSLWSILGQNTFSIYLPFTMSNP